MYRLVKCLARNRWLICGATLLVALACKEVNNLDSPNADLRTEILIEILTDTTNGLIKGKNPVFSSTDVTGLSTLSIPGGKQSYVESEYLCFILNEPDSAFVKQQMKMRKYFRFDSLTFKEFTVIGIDELWKSRSNDFFWELMDRKYGGGYYSTSMPIFNKSYDLCYFKISYYCNGHCGHGVEVLAEKQGLKWAIKERLGGWVS